jgi:peptide chain release factor 1
VKQFKRRKKDFTVQTFRSGGPGGQNVNKVETGVRIIDKTTGLRAESTEHRTQAANKRAAFLRMVDLLVEHYTEEQVREEYMSDERVRTYHDVDNYVLDHATGARSTFGEIVDKGDIEEMVMARLMEKVGGEDA